MSDHKTDRPYTRSTRLPILLMVYCVLCCHLQNGLAKVVKDSICEFKSPTVIFFHLMNNLL